MPDSIKKPTNSQQIPLKIYWHEGMLLSQHLFQQNDLRNFLIRSKQLSLISHYHWGIVSLSIDNNALSNNLFRIDNIVAVFPDGLYFEYTANTKAGLNPLELNLENIADKELMVSLAIAKLTCHTSPLSGNKPRFYSIEGELVHDENFEGNDISVPRLVPNVFLHIGSILPEGCIGFPIAYIEKINDNFYLTNWTPPCFYISKNSFIWKQCSELIILFRDKLNILNAKLLNSEGMISLDTRQLLMQLVMIVTPFEAMLYSDEIKPYELFRELSRLLGGVLVLSINTSASEYILPPVPTYNHKDIDSCILPLISSINKCLASIDSGYIIVRFNKREHFFYKYITQQDIDISHDKKLCIGVSGSKLSEMQDIVNWMKKAVIVSDFALDSIRFKRTHGAVRHELSADIAPKILPEPCTILFEVEINQQYIKAEQNLHIFNPGSDSKFQPKNVALYLPRSENAGK